MKTTPRIAIALALLLLLACSPSVLAVTHPWPNHVPFTRVLADVVRDERIDYVAVKARHLPALTAYLGDVTQFLGGLSREGQLATYINVYNATGLKAVAERYKPGYSVSENNFAFFKEPLVKIGDKTVSLDDLEHKIIRPTFKDPRIHVALVCAAVSCPPIRPRAYEAYDLDKLLDENMRRFVADRGRNPIDDRTRTLRLSRLFEWYADDFGGRQAVPAYVGRYAGKDYANWKVEYVEYDWSLNSR
jgi:hypothetical protein